MSIKTSSQHIPIALPKTYFDLVERVGSSGRYQFRIMLLFLIIWFVTGFILMSTAFLFRNRSFDCLKTGLLATDCNNYVCALPSGQWLQFISEQDKSWNSLSTQFGNYYCQNAYIIDIASMFTYLGAFVGYVIISFFSDNFGRKTSMAIAWATTTIGTVLVACSVNIYMAVIGLFLSGAGGDASINICFFFFGEVVQDKKRQQYSVGVQVLFTLGAMCITVLFYFIGQWRIVWIVGAVVPAFVGIIGIIFYLEETPQFLLRRGATVALKSLNRMGEINFSKKSLLSDEDIQHVCQQMATKQSQLWITPVDLIRFPSLRVVTIACSIISFMTYGMYYGPTLIIDDIGFNIYISSLMVQLSQLVIFLPAFIYIERIARKTFGILLYAIAVVMAGILIFVSKPEYCELCLESFVELVIIFIFRLCVSFFFCFFQVYVCELYPSRARGLGSGIVSAVGTIASTVSPLLLGQLKRQGINVMIFFVMFGIVAIGCLTLLEETKGVALKEEIEQVELEKQHDHFGQQNFQEKKLLS